MACTGCASELTPDVLCQRCIGQGWEQLKCGCVYDQDGEQVTRCDDCEQNAAEDAYERFLEDYYGSSGPVTVQEHYDRAAAQKRTLR